MASELSENGLPRPKPGASKSARRDSTSQKRNVDRAYREANGIAVVRADVPLTRFLEAAARHGHIERDEIRILENASRQDRAMYLQRINEAALAFYCSVVLGPADDSGTDERSAEPGDVHPLDAIEAASGVLRQSPVRAVFKVAQALNLVRHSGVPFEAALGLAPGWFTAQLKRGRDDLLLEIANRIGGDTARAKARAAEAALRKYEASGWRQHREQRRRPSGIDGLCYDFLTTGPTVGAEKIRKLLGYS